MIRVELEEQTAADLLDIVTRLQAHLTEEHPVAAADVRAVRLTLSGALRAAGWTPTPDGAWAKQPTRPRR